MKNDKKLPLNVYIFYSGKGEQSGFTPSTFAQELFHCWFNKIEDSSSSGIGIPVYPISNIDAAEAVIAELKKETKEEENAKSSPSKKASKKDSKGAEYNVFFLLIDKTMMEEERWKNAVKKLYSKTFENIKNHITPVAFHHGAYDFCDELDDYPIICPYDGIRDIKTVYKLQCTEVLCRLLYKASSKNHKARLSIFLSHPQGKSNHKILENLRKTISNRYNFEAFFDLQEVLGGNTFTSQLAENKREAILLAFQMDNYAAEEWCQKEFLLAKEYNCPIVIYNCLNLGEKRKSPYMGNVPCIHIYQDRDSHKNKELKDNISDMIIFHALLEALRFKYQELYSKYILSHYNYLKDKVKVLNRPPELFTLLTNRPDKPILLYPDPPLGNTEISVLRRLPKPQLTFLTPNLIPFYDGSKFKKFLAGSRISLSISKSTKIEDYGLIQTHLLLAAKEITRYLFAAGAKIAYGGTIFHETSSEEEKLEYIKTLINLARSVREQFVDKNIQIINYKTAIPSLKQKETEKKWTEASNKKTKEQPHEEYFLDEFKEEIVLKTITLSPPPILQKLSPEKKLTYAFHYSENLSKMRFEMARDSNAHIILGGNLEKPEGRISGIIEETIYALKAKNPIFLIGGFGGAARYIIENLKNSPLKKSVAEPIDNEELNKYYTTQADKLLHSKLDLQQAQKILNETTIKKLNNGLRKEENETLFESKNIFEIIQLILKGLRNKLGDEKNIYGLLEEWGLEKIVQDINFLDTPAQFSTGDKNAAWKMHTELITGIAALKLKQFEGEESALLPDLKALSTITKEIIVTEGGDCHQFAEIATGFLSKIIRPFIRKCESIAKDDSPNKNLPTEVLNRLEKRLRNYAKLMKEIADVKN